MRDRTKRCIRLFCLLAGALFLLSVPRRVPAAGEEAPSIRVLLRRLAITDRMDLALEGDYVIRSGETALVLGRGSEVTVQVHEGRLYLYCGDMHMRLGQGLVFERFGEGGALRVEGSSGVYPGDLSLTVSGGMLQPILRISAEAYLEGVLPYEMAESFPLEALKAQAVCARTYAIAHIDPSRDYDVVDTTNDQVYRGSGNHPRCLRAIRETAGLIGTFRGEPVMCFYTASNGGQTELPSHVWKGEPNTVYAITDDPYDTANPESPVRRAYLSRTSPDLPDDLMALLADALKPTLEKLGFDPAASSLRVDSLSKLELKKSRFASPSRLMTELDITLAFSGRKPLSPVQTTPSLAGGTYAEDEDMLFFVTDTPAPAVSPGALGPLEKAPEEVTVSLPLFPGVLRALSLSIYGADNEIVTVREERGRFVLESGRYGHGVGMSQRGAQYMAEHEKWTFDRILAFYYPGMELRRAPDSEAPLPTPEGALIHTPQPAASPTPRPTLVPLPEGSLPNGARVTTVEGIEDDSSLNLRSEPSTASDILMRLYKHQPLVVLEACEDPVWLHVLVGPLEGYIMASFLEPTPSPAPGT